MKARKLTALPQKLADQFMHIPKSEDFVLDPIPEKKILTTENRTTMTPLEEQFEAAKKRVLDLPEKPSNEKMLELYALNKQATIGDVNVDKPAMFDFVAAAKYNAWTAKKGMRMEEAQQKYIDAVNALLK
jgi:acyl-CoA-binding protein